MLVPLEFVTVQPADLPGQGPEPLITPITNGLGAGPTLEHALGHGLLELIQRDGNSVNFRALAGDTAVALDSVADPGPKPSSPASTRRGWTWSSSRPTVTSA